MASLSNHCGSAFSYPGLMEFRTIFFNQQDHLRAGWRIAIFVAVLMLVSMLLVGPLMLFAPDLAYVAFCIAVALSTYAVLRIVDKRPFRSVGLALHSRPWIEFAQGAVMGAVLISIVVIVELVLGCLAFSWRALSLLELFSTFALQLASFAAVAFAEELLFRGYVFQTLIEGTNRIFAVAVMSVGFGAAHLSNPNVTMLGTSNIVLVAIWFSIAYLRTRSLWMPIAFHLAWNFIMGYVYSLPVSGLHFPGHLLSVQQSGPEWLTGGAFGPEGSALTTVVLIIGIAYIAASKSVKIGEGVWQLETVRSRSGQVQDQS